MKRIVLVLIFSLIIGSASLFAFRLGIQGGVDVSSTSVGGLAVTFKLDDQPWVFAVDTRIYSDAFGIGVSADQWLFNKPITGSLKWFFGWGLYANLLFDDSVGFCAGGRLPIGLNMYFAEGFVEPYLQIAMALGFKFYSGLTFEWFVPINLGVRVWF